MKRGLKMKIDDDFDIEEEYEKAINLYLENGYQIVAQQENATILQSDAIKGDRLASGIGGAIAGSPTTVATMATAVNTRQNEYQVTIRITKTGQLQITGYTLDKCKKHKEQMQISIIVTIIIVVVALIIVFAIFARL